MRPRAVALGIVFWDKSILVQELSGRHSRGTGTHYRPIGGTIEYGEKSVETVVREFGEETGMAIEIIRYLGCIENVFTLDGEIGHDIDFIYLVGPVDEAWLSHDALQVTENQSVWVARWIPLADFQSGKAVLYPGGLADLLTSRL